MQNRKEGEIMMKVKELEFLMWEAAKRKDGKGFLELVNEDAVMVCGGFRCNGAQYAQIVNEFDLAEYEISAFETVVETEEVCQIHYVISTKVADEKNSDLEGRFHITSTWKKMDGNWKLVFNMDSRILGDNTDEYSD